MLLIAHSSCRTPGLIPCRLSSTRSKNSNFTKSTHHLLLASRENLDTPIHDLGPRVHRIFTCRPEGIVQNILAELLHSSSTNCQLPTLIMYKLTFILGIRNMNHHFKLTKKVPSKNYFVIRHSLTANC